MNQANNYYWAFISYRHADNKIQDRDWATWLHQEIERYEVPAELIGTDNERGDTIPERIYPIFRDEESLPADANLGQSITNALDRSLFLVALCSPKAVESKYVAQEINHFKETAKGERLIAAIIAGEPGDIEQECFPEPLRKIASPDGKLMEPIAADFRLSDGAEGYTSAEAYKRALLDKKIAPKQAQRLAEAYDERLQLMKLKIIAGILGVPLETLRDRDKAYQLTLAKKRQRTLTGVIALISLFAIAAVIAGVFANEQRKIALQQEQQSKRNLSKLYNEKAQQMDFHNNDESIAWSLKAAEADSSIIRSSMLNHRVLESIDEVALPTKSIQSNRLSNGTGVIEWDKDYAVSKKLERFVSITGNKSVTLYDSKNLKKIKNIEIEEQINSIKFHEENDLFILTTFNGVYLVHWKDGTLIPKIGDSRLVADRNVHISADYILFSTEEKAELLYQDENEIHLIDGPKLPKDLAHVHIWKQEERIHFLVIPDTQFSKNDSVNVIHASKGNEENNWSIQEVFFKEKKPSKFQFFHKENVLAFYYENGNLPNALIDLNNLSSHDISMDSELGVVLGIRRAEEGLEVLTQNMEIQPSLHRISVKTNMETPIFPNKEISNAFYHTKADCLIGLNGETGHLEIDDMKGNKRSLVLSNFKNVLSAIRLEEISASILGIISSRRVGYGIHLVDLENMKCEVWSGAVSSPQKFLWQNNDMKSPKCSVLSHGGKMISQFNNLEKTWPTVQQDIKIPNTHDFLSCTISDTGEPIVYTEESDEVYSHIYFHRQGSPQKKIFKVKRTFIDENDFDPHTPSPSFEIVNNQNFLISKEYSCRLVKAATNGQVLYERENVIKYFIFEEARHGIFITENTIEIVNLKSGEIHKEITQLGESPRNFFYEEERELLSWTSSYRHNTSTSVTFENNFHLHVLNIKNDKKTTSLVKGYYHWLHIPISLTTFDNHTEYIARNSDELIQIRIKNNNVIENKVICKIKNDIHNAALWAKVSDDSYYYIPPDGEQSQPSIGHALRVKNGWKTNYINLKSKAKSLSVSPNKKWIIIHSDVNTFIYNTANNEMKTIEEKNLSSNITILNNERSIIVKGKSGYFMEYDLNSGSAINTYSELGQSECNAYFSPNHEWIGTITMGEMKVSRADQSYITLDELRDAAQLLGGLQVTEDDTVIPWIENYPRKN